MTTTKTRKTTRCTSFTSSMNQQITKVYTEEFPSIKSNLVGANEAKRKLQMMMWDQQQDTIIAARKNIHITNDKMREVYENHMDWQHLMTTDGTPISMKVYINNIVLAHQVRMKIRYDNKTTFKDKETIAWRNKIREKAKKEKKSFKTIFEGMFY